MVRKNKTFAFLFIFFLMLSVTTQQPQVKAQSNQSPVIEFQKEYGDSETAGVSNIFQTTDGGYIFMDWGRSHYWNGEAAIFYKVDSSGNMQWNKTVLQFHPSSVIQTSDGGYELFGVDFSTPTLIKMNSQGNIRWIASDSNLEQQIGASSFQTIYDAKDGSIKTSDGGYAKWTLGSIIKTDSYNNTEWIENFTSPSDNYIGISPLPFFSLIETSDGALAALCVGYYRASNHYTGTTIYLIKTEPFLPVPSPAKLQAPLPAPYSLEVTILFVSILIIIEISLLLLIKHRRKPANSSLYLRK